MELTLSNPRVENGAIKATLTAGELSVDVCCHVELLEQWGDELVRAFLAKEGSLLLRTQLNDLQVQATLDVNGITARTHEQEELDAANLRVSDLAALSTELDADTDAAMDTFYTALEAHYANDSERLACVQEERAAWDAAHPDVSALAGSM